MEKVRYMISDAANVVEVETHVLRYWEDELGLDIPRNDLGHRYYTRENIQQFIKIKELKEQGYQLRAIKEILKGNSVPQQTTVERTPEARMEEFKELMNSIVGKAISANNEELSQTIGTEVQEKILKELNYLVREQNQAAEDRYNKLHEAIKGNARRKVLFFKKKKEKLKPLHMVE